MRENTPSFCDYCNVPEPEAGSMFPQTDEERDAFKKRITDDGTSIATVKIHIQYANQKREGSYIIFLKKEFTEKLSRFISLVHYFNARDVCFSKLWNVWQ